MATGTITNHLQDPSGTALVGVTVTARLQPIPTGFRASTNSEISQLETTTTDSNGDWALVLEINTDITPGDSYWEINELIPATAGVPRVWAVQVGAGTNSLYASLVSTPPYVAVPSYITQSSGDARWQPYGVFTLGSIQAVGTATQTGTATTAASSSHVHPLSPAVVGTGLTLTSGVIQVAGGYEFTRTGTTTTTVGLAAGTLQFNTASAAVFLFNGANQVCITPQTAQVSTSQTTASATYTDLSTAGPSVTLFTGTRALVTIQAKLSMDAAGHLAFVAPAISGATTVAAADTKALSSESYTAGAAIQAAAIYEFTGLTPGLHTFTLKYRSDNAANTATFANRSITVVGT